MFYPKLEPCAVKVACTVLRGRSGRNPTPLPDRNIEDVGITEEEALVLLGNDISRVITELDRNIPTFSGLDEIRKRVLVDMCFNLGISRLMKFRRMLAALEAFDYAQAAVEMMDSRWAHQVGNRAKRLKHMMKTGEEQ